MRVAPFVMAGVRNPQRKLPSTVLLANSLSEANGMAVTPLQADVVGNGHYATAELLAGNRFKRPEHA